MKNVFFCIITFVTLSISANAQTLREKFLEGKKNHQEVVDAYNKLSDAEQKGLWQEKFDQLLTLKLPKEHLDLIKKLSDDFSDGVDSDSSEDFFVTASKLAQITPVKDFGYMFETLNDYVYDSKFIDSKKLSDEFINDVKNLNPFVNLNDVSAKGKCSCRWCLGMGTTGNNCTITEHGCGFLWLQSCNQCLLCL